MDLNDIDMNNLPDLAEVPLSRFLNALTALRDEHMEQLKTCTANSVPLSAVHHLVIAALRRSTSLIEGFLVLFDMKNKFCAIPLIRMQLDSAMRVHACSLVNDSTQFVKHILEGEELRKFKQTPRIDLSDSKLHRRLTEKYSLTSDLYRETNGYVHLSKQHLFGIFDQEGLQNGNVALTDFDSLPPWSELDMKGSLVQLLWASHVLAEECKAILKTTAELNEET